MRELILQKLRSLVESSDFDKWFNDSAAAARKGQPMLDQEKRNMGISPASDPAFPYIGNTKKKPISILDSGKEDSKRYWKPEDGTPNGQYWFVHVHNLASGHAYLIHHCEEAVHAYQIAQDEANVSKGYKYIAVTLGSYRPAKGLDTYYSSIHNTMKLSNSDVGAHELQYRNNMKLGSGVIGSDGSHSMHGMIWDCGNPATHSSGGTVNVLTDPKAIDHITASMKWR